MRLTKFLWRKCKVCMRILLLKSFLLGTNCPSFLPILCGFLFVFVVESFLFLPWMPLCIFRGILFVFCRGFLLFCRGIFFVSAVDSFCFAVESFLFLPWIPFVFAVDSFVYIPSFFLFFSFLPCSFYYLPRNPKNVGDFLEKVHRFLEKVHRFLGLISNV